MVDVAITSAAIGATGAKFYFVGVIDGTPGKIVLDGDRLNSGVLRVRRLAVKDGGGKALIDLALAQELDVPAALVNEDGARLQTAAELQDQLAGLADAKKRAFLAFVDEAQRRCASIEINADAGGMVFLGIDSPFGSAAGFAAAHAKLDLWAVTGPVSTPTIAVSVRAELAACAHLRIGNLTRSVALVCVFDKAVGARLRVDADDFNVSLPEFTLPSFDLPTVPKLDLSGPLSGAARVFQRLDPHVAVTVTHTIPANPDQPKLALRARPAGKGIDWALVTPDFDPAGDWNNLGAKLAEFEVTIAKAAPAVSVTVSQLKLADIGAGSTVTGTVTVNGGAIPIGNGARQLGPLEVSWNDVTITPTASGFNIGNGHAEAEHATLRCEVAFARLMLRVRDDPDAVLAFAGKIELTPSGARIIKLDLIQPYPIELVAQAVDGLARAAGSVAKVVFDFARATIEQVEELLRIVGKIAAAAGRAAIFVAKVAGEAIDTVADLVGKGLVAIAEVLAEALKALSRLIHIPDAPGVPGAPDLTTRFAVEVRFATDPFELRQILLTLRGDNATGDRAVQALGVDLTIKGGWQPGVLIDVVNQPGAYLVLSRQAPPAGELDVATVSTDLWLKREEAADSVKNRTAAVRDAEGGEPGRTSGGDRAAEPLLGVTLKLKAATATVMIVLAGLSRGRGVFFQRIAGEVSDPAFPVPLPNGVKVRTTAGAFSLVPIDFDKDFDVEVKLQKDRILPLLGMGEPGTERKTGGASQPGFLEKLKGSLSNVIWVKDTTKPSLDVAKRQAGVGLVLGLKAAGLETEITLGVSLSLDSFEVKIDASKVFPIVSRRIEERGLGLVWVVEQKDQAERLADMPVEMFQLGFGGGQSGFELNAAKARMELRFEGLSSDGKGVVFEVATFTIGPGGLDLVAKVRDNPVRLNGVDVPFRFTSGSLEIKGGRLVSAAIAGRGSLPPKLIGEADCTVALTFGEDASEGVVLQSGKVELDKKGDPIICHASRFTLTITDLDISFVKDNGYHFFYLVTGSLRFTPKSGEFESGLLQYLDGVEMNLERTPLSADPRVLLKHISFQKALNPKKSFNLFNLFTFELRGFGYHPASPKFGGDPAVNISGQIKFVEIGDVMQPKIDFHGLWIAPPAPNQSLPRIKADGLGIDLNLKGSIRVRGSVLAVDPDTKTVEGRELAPAGYNTYGFLGEGEFDIPGWGSMAASLGFLELEKQDRPGDRRKSFFFYAEKRQISVEIPAVIWTFYLREVGFGLGFRYTLEALSAADQATSVPKLIHALDEVSKRQGDLHRFSAWRPEVDGDRVTLALKGAIQSYPAAKTWNEEQEEAAQNPFLFDLVAAIRSDFTLFMGLRGWLATNYIDYLNDKDGLRSNPGLRGYLYISAPQKRLLARMIADSKGYIGERIPALKKTDSGEPPLRRALRATDWSATLFIKPGLFHYELGWPNQLAVRLMDEPNMRVTVRGGMIFRAADDGLLWGYNIEADAFFRFSGALQIGPVGVAAEASLDAHLVARVICYLSWRFTGSLIYGLISLDATLAISIRAWLEVDLGIKKFTIRIGFSISLQFSAAIEVVISTDGVGAHVHARVAVCAFGSTLSVSVGFAIGGGQLAEARARVQRFMAMSITSEDPDTAPSFASKSGDSRIDSDARNAEASATAPKPADVNTKPAPGIPLDKPSRLRAKFGDHISETHFWLVLHKATCAPDGSAAGDEFAYAMLVPRDRKDETDPFPSSSMLRRRTSTARGRARGTVRRRSTRSTPPARRLSGSCSVGTQSHGSSSPSRRRTRSRSGGRRRLRTTPRALRRPKALRLRICSTSVSCRIPNGTRMQATTTASIA